MTSKNAKKKLNLTGTLPKGLLSPTNNGYKHKHSDYFESTNVIPGNKSFYGKNGVPLINIQ